jgi:hypothetical protein
MKFIEPRPFADPDSAARKLIELANAFEPNPGRQDLSPRADWSYMRAALMSGSRTQAQRCSPDPA